ncbi:MAG: hypothetical protein ACKV0T_08405 [Planctomycetales bacterium]
MRTMLFTVAVAAALLPGLIGCSQNPNLVRGQNPEFCPVPEGMSGEYCPPDDGMCHNGCHGPHCCHCRPYCIPNDLVYPPPGDAPAIVQYPYYTTKGPDCFFHQ